MEAELSLSVSIPTSVCLYKLRREIQHFGVINVSEVLIIDLEQLSWSSRMASKTRQYTWHTWPEVRWSKIYLLTIQTINRCPEIYATCTNTIWSFINHVLRSKQNKKLHPEETLGRGCWERGTLVKGWGEFDANYIECSAPGNLWGSFKFPWQF